MTDEITGCRYMFNTQSIKFRKVVSGLSLLTALGIIFYWMSVFAGLFPVAEAVPGYRDWFMSFPLADFWIAACALATFIFLMKEDERSIVTGIATGSGMIFLGLYALAYGLNTGLLFNLTADELVEIAIKLYCLIVGPLLIVYFWEARHHILPRVIRG